VVVVVAVVVCVGGCLIVVVVMVVVCVGCGGCGGCACRPMLLGAACIIRHSSSDECAMSTTIKMEE